MTSRDLRLGLVVLTLTLLPGCWPAESEPPPPFDCDEIDRADDQIQAAEHVIRQIERTICENIHFDALQQSKACEALVQPIDFGALCRQSGSIEAPGHRQPAGMIGDGEIPKSATPGRVRHLFQTMPTVRRGRMGVQVPHEILQLQQDRKPPFIRRLELAAVLS